MAEDRTEIASAVGNADPIVGVTPGDLIAALSRWGAALAARPTALGGRAVRLGRELGRVVAGRSDVKPPARDRRFSDPSWTTNPVYRRLLQGYLAAADALQRSVDDAGLDERAAQRARFALMLVAEAGAPTNTLLGNPAALKRALDTGGGSLAQGARAALRDLRSNGAMPRQVPADAFTVGETLAATPGAVVLRTDVCEVIQYQPATDEVAERPLLIVPPQINKFYAIDLAPGRSFVEYAVSRGLQVFVVSWRNPTPAQRDWSLDTYLEGLIAALDAMRDITGIEDANALGLCSGGITLTMLLGHLAGVRDLRIRAATLGVTGLDTRGESPLHAFVSEPAVAAAIARSRRSGVLEGRSMARMFSWLRPNDLVWNYWVNNYLMGQDPPPFDLLYWNADTTNLPAALHAQYARMMIDNPLITPGGIAALGVPVDLGAVDADLYVMAGTTDHIVPWETAYGSARLFGGDVTFVLSASGHIQSIVNPPGNPKATYLTAPKLTDDPQGWLDSADRRQGTWWAHWADWLLARSGSTQPAAGALGSDLHPPGDPAPGRYVRA